ncbi:MAG: hypothetical protein JO149_08050 [Gammaproteobacteria bacterium]|nr:hypothetical protein [Gammaproteobacteria bacterium]
MLEFVFNKVCLGENWVCVFTTISAVGLKYILTSKAQHEGRVRAIVKMYFKPTAEIVVKTQTQFSPKQTLKNPEP